MAATPAGWYQDPDQPIMRYWDGSSWTDRTAPVAGSSMQPPVSNATAPLPRLPADTVKPWWKRKRFAIPGGILAALIVLGALGSAFGSKPSKKVASNVTATTSVAATASPTPSPTRTTPSARRKATAASTTARPTKTKSSSATAASGGSFAMPQEVGAVLQDAQDNIQRVSGDPIFVTHSHDLLGSRFQIFDSNWQVCTQNVPAGQTVSAVGHIDFGVVKIGEQCP